MPYFPDSFAPQLLAVFVTGILGGVHCVGMCGGVVAALSGRPGVGAPLQQVAWLQSPGKLSPHPLPLGQPPAWTLQLAFNLARIAMYTVAGAAAGAVFESTGSFARAASNALPLHAGLALFANLMLLALGLYLIGITRHLAVLERAGGHLWRAMRPAVQRVLPANTLPRALALGALWGWTPCGLVYSMLAIALVSGSAVHGALVMLAFGLGTLPNLLLAGVLMRWINQHRAGGWMRYVAGVSVLGMAMFGLAHAAHLDGSSAGAMGGWLCFTL
jgi:uncharacterized protein